MYLRTLPVLVTAINNCQPVNSANWSSTADTILPDVTIMDYEVKP